jgi:hypothetical protein
MRKGEYENRLVRDGWVDRRGLGEGLHSIDPRERVALVARFVHQKMARQAPRGILSSNHALSIRLRRPNSGPLSFLLETAKVPREIEIAGTRSFSECA